MTTVTSPAAAPSSLGPTVPVTPRWAARFALVWLGVWMAQLVPIQLALPDQLFDIDHAHRVRDFGLINGLVGVAAIITLPLFGAMCDRTRTRFGRRRTWVAAGAVVYAVGLVSPASRPRWAGWRPAGCWPLSAGT